MDYNYLTKEELIEEIQKFEAMSDNEIKEYNKFHKHSAASRVQEIKDVLAEKLDIDKDAQYQANAINICKNLGVNYNINRDYSPENRDKVDDEYKVITVALAKGILKNSFEPEKVQKKLYKKNVISSADLTEREINIQIVRTIILDIVHLTPEQYHSIYSTKINKSLHVYDFVRKIVDSCSTEEKDLYGIDNKEILFNLVFPEYVEKTKATGECFQNYIYAKGSQKAALIKAGKIKDTKLNANRPYDEFCMAIDDIPISKHGVLVDKKICESIEQAFQVMGTTDRKRMLLMLDDYKRFFVDLRYSVPGFTDIIKARSIYTSPMDFYYSQLSKEDRIELFDTYYELKKKEGQTVALDLLKEFVDENRYDIEKMAYDEFELDE